MSRRQLADGLQQWKVHLHQKLKQVHPRIREAIIIRERAPTPMKGDSGAYILSHTLDTVLEKVSVSRGRKLTDWKIHVKEANKPTSLTKRTLNIIVILVFVL